MPKEIAHFVPPSFENGVIISVKLHLHLSPIDHYFEATEATFHIDRFPFVIHLITYTRLRPYLLFIFGFESPFNANINVTSKMIRSCCQVRE